MLRRSIINFSRIEFYFFKKSDISSGVEFYEFLINISIALWIKAQELQKHLKI